MSWTEISWTRKLNTNSLTKIVKYPMACCNSNCYLCVEFPGLLYVAAWTWPYTVKHASILYATKQKFSTPQPNHTEQKLSAQPPHSYNLLSVQCHALVSGVKLVFFKGVGTAGATGVLAPAMLKVSFRPHNNLPSVSADWQSNFQKSLFI